MSQLVIHDLTKTYGSVSAIDHANLKADTAELVALLGPSGCGKTTMLRAIAGFVSPNSGTIEVDGEDITRLAPNKRNTGMVFQNYALFPNMTVAGNVAFGLEMRGVPKADIRQRVAEALQLVSLASHADRFPRQLSGGQQQRVAVARALVVKPDVFLLDEPLSNLDATLRQSVGQQLRGLQKRLGLTTIFVTHDQKEALMIADRLVIMRDGRVVQEGSANHLYNHPATNFVAEFLGSSNVLRGKIVEGGFMTAGGMHVRCDTSGASQAAVLSLRPENVLLADEATRLVNATEGRIRHVVYLGSYTEVDLELPGGDRLIAHRQNRVGDSVSFTAEAIVAVGWNPEACRLLIEDMPQ
jgi:putative spermidine/putrescine transport system ATP-binding protein